ncbi:uncharacterized mitochondrial protein AtMg00240-like [Nicotiana sylvestris]|uniref:uncharacterized mitochondrial protein AtMg00240-like n=1 Tax=Nicotiana sylvestris TaxID=4096 RepID=UPI00388C360C
MTPATSLDKDEEGTVDESKYRGMIGFLLYLTASRPDIMFSVCRCVRFQSAPKESHLTAVKQIIRYLIETTSHGLWYSRLNNFKLEGFLVVDLARDKDKRKSKVKHVNYNSSPAIVRNRDQSHYLQLKLNTLLSDNVVLNYSG